MLRELQIRDFALIEDLELSFYSGFSVLSGETGAGKSIIIDALSLLLGARASTEVIRTGAERALISGSFTPTPAASALLDEWGLSEEELIITREINSSGRSRCWINGRLAAVNQLSALGACLVDIVGQHDSQSLLKPENHVQLLDSYGGSAHLQLLERADELANRWLALRAEQRRLQSDERERIRRLDLLAYQIEEITAADLQIGEDEQLEQERSRLANLDRIRQAVQYAVTMLGESCGDGEPVLSLLSLVEAELDRAAALDAPLEPLSQRYAELVINLQELYRDLRDHLENLPADPGRLNEVEERLELLDRLKRKYGNTVEEIIGYRERVEAELAALQQAEVRAAGLDEECQRLAQQWLGLAEQLSRSRLDLAQRLEEQIGVELSDLAMDGTRFRVQFLPQPGDHPVLGGRERVEFMLAANAGEELKPLAKVASGGELSRVLLALKAILARAEQIPTVVFDEVDAGIGGRTAVKLGEKLRALGEVRQVLCVTHLPVVASFGTHHYSVQKFTQEGRTAVRAALLAPEERVLELTRMLGGSADEQVASEHARELLRRTEAAAGKLELGS